MTLSARCTANFLEAGFEVWYDEGDEVYDIKLFYGPLRVAALRMTLRLTTGRAPMASGTVCPECGHDSDTARNPRLAAASSVSDSCFGSQYYVI